MHVRTGPARLSAHRRQRTWQVATAGLASHPAPVRSQRSPGWTWPSPRVAPSSARASPAPRGPAPAAALPFFGSRKASAPKKEEGSPPPVQPPHFDLPLAVVLAGCAFEAYLQPQGDQGFKQRSVGGPEITYTDKTFLTEIYTGVLLVEVVSASNLRAADSNGKSDPYVVLSVGGCSFKSTTKVATLNPKWNESTCMYIKDPATDVLRVRLYDADVGKSDDDLGLTMLGLGPLGEAGASGKWQQFTLPLRGNGSGQGATVTLRARFLAFKDQDPEKVAALTATTTTAPTETALAGLQAAAAAVAAAVPLMTGAKEEEEVPKVTMPGGEEVDNPWRVLAVMAGRASGSSQALSPVAFVENEETDTQVWLYRNVELKEAVIAFRGTEQVKWKDIATDLNLTPCSLNPERVDDNAGLPFTARIAKAVSGANQGQLMVHKGFLDAYDSVRRAVFTLLDEITGAGGKGGPWRVLVTGHSLGGALATLAAYELAERRTPARRVQALSLYSFGAPRVGNKAFADEFDHLIPDTWRITNTNDIVPSVPRLMGYAHVGHSVRLGADGQLVVGRSRSESTDVFGEGKAGAEVIAEIVSQVSEQARPWDEVYEAIKDREMKLLDALVGGQGLEEHMETFYLASLQQAVEAARAQQASK